MLFNKILSQICLSIFYYSAPIYPTSFPTSDCLFFAGTYLRRMEYPTQIIQSLKYFFVFYKYQQSSPTSLPPTQYSKKSIIRLPCLQLMIADQQCREQLVGAQNANRNERPAVVAPISTTRSSKHQMRANPKPDPAPKFEAMVSWVSLQWE